MRQFIERSFVILVLPEDFEENDTTTAIFNEYYIENGGEMTRNAHKSSIRRVNITN